MSTTASDANREPERHTNEVCRAQQDAWLSDANRIMRHRYRRCGFSGAGNCCCGYTRDSIVHPHEFVRSHSSAQQNAWRCVCGKTPDHDIHKAESAL